MKRAVPVVLVASFLLLACGEKAAPVDEPQCRDDTECKGERTCEDGVCVDPPYNPTTTGTGATGGAATTSGGGGAGGTGPGVLPGPCLVDVKCVYDSDCPDGHHCNDSIPIPQCEELYCGQEGTLCSEDELCQPGLFCLALKCSQPPPCNCAAACDQAVDCGFGPLETCLNYCASHPAALACWCEASMLPDFCSQAFDCTQQP